MKKLFALLLSFLMLFTLTACEEEDVDLALDIAWAVLEELEDYLTEYQKAGYPMVSHSEQYRKAYRPAYRIVLKRLLPEEMTIEAGRNKL